MEVKSFAEFCLDKQKVREAIEKSREHHKNQLEIDIQPQIIKHHHEIIIDFIDNELKERLKELGL